MIDDHAKPDDHPDFLGRYTPNGILHMTGLPDPTNVDIYVCGPHMFMAEMVSGFKKLGVPDANIHFEFFGPLRSTDVMEVMKANKGAEARA